MSLEEILTNILLMPLVRPQDAERRIRQTRSQFEMFENLKQLRKIRRKALLPASLGKWRIIDAGKPIAEVEMEIAQALQPSFQGVRF